MSNRTAQREPWVLGPTAKDALAWCLRGVGLVSMALWFGGFTFYSAVAIPALHDQFEPLSVGEVTRQVTWTLNAIGVLSVSLWWAGARPGARRLSGKACGVLLGISSVLLVVQIGLHHVMANRLDAGSLDSFYPLHRLYLWVSTVQWAANLGLLLLVAATNRPDP